MAKEVAVENGRISNFEGPWTLEQVILHTVVHQLSTSTYMPNFTEIEETFCGQTDGRTHGQCQVQSHVTQKLGQIWPDKIYRLCPSLRICGQLPAPFVNGGR